MTINEMGGDGGWSVQSLKWSDIQGGERYQVRVLVSRPYPHLGEDRARDWDSFTYFSSIGGPISINKSIRK